MAGREVGGGVGMGGGGGLSILRFFFNLYIHASVQRHIFASDLNMCTEIGLDDFPFVQFIHR